MKLALALGLWALASALTGLAWTWWRKRHPLCSTPGCLRLTRPQPATCGPCALWSARENVRAYDAEQRAARYDA